MKKKIKSRFLKIHLSFSVKTQRALLNKKSTEEVNTLLCICKSRYWS